MIVCGGALPAQGASLGLLWTFPRDAHPAPDAFILTVTQAEQARNSSSPSGSRGRLYPDARGNAGGVLYPALLPAARHNCRVLGASHLAPAAFSAK